MARPTEANDGIDQLIRWPYFIIARGPVIETLTPPSADGRTPGVYQAYYHVLAADHNVAGGVQPAPQAGTAPAPQNTRQVPLGQQTYGGWSPAAYKIKYGAQIQGDATGGFPLDTALRGAANTWTGPAAGMADLFSVLGDLKYFWFQGAYDLTVRPAWSWMAQVGGVNDAWAGGIPGSGDGQRAIDSLETWGFDDTDNRFPTGQPSGQMVRSLTVPPLKYDAATTRFVRSTLGSLPGGTVKPTWADNTVTLGLPPSVSLPYAGVNNWVETGGNMTFPDIVDRDTRLSCLANKNAPGCSPAAVGGAVVGAVGGAADWVTAKTPVRAEAVGAAATSCAPIDCSETACKHCAFVAGECQCDCFQSDSCTSCNGQTPTANTFCVSQIDSSQKSSCGCKDCSYLVGTDATSCSSASIEGGECVCKCDTACAGTACTGANQDKCVVGRDGKSCVCTICEDKDCTPGCTAATGTCSYAADSVSTTPCTCQATCPQGNDPDPKVAVKSKCDAGCTKCARPAGSSKCACDCTLAANAENCGGATAGKCSGTATCISFDIPKIDYSDKCLAPDACMATQCPTATPNCTWDVRTSTCTCQASTAGQGHSSCRCDCAANGACLDTVGTGQICAWDLATTKCTVQSLACAATECSCPAGVACQRVSDGTCQCSCSTGSACGVANHGASCQKCESKVLPGGLTPTCQCDCSATNAASGAGACPAGCTKCGQAVDASGVATAGCECQCDVAGACGSTGCNKATEECLLDGDTGLCTCQAATDGGGAFQLGPVLHGLPLTLDSASDTVALGNQAGGVKPSNTVLGVALADVNMLNARTISLNVSDVRHPAQVWRTYSVEQPASQQSNLKPVGGSNAHARCNVFSPRNTSDPTRCSNPNALLTDDQVARCKTLDQIINLQGSGYPVMAGSGWRIGRPQARVAAPTGVIVSNLVSTPYDSAIPTADELVTTVTPGRPADTAAKAVAGWVSEVQAQWPVGSSASSFNGLLSGTATTPAAGYTLAGLVPFASAGGNQLEAPAPAGCNCPVGTFGANCDYRTFAPSTNACNATGPVAPAGAATQLPLCSGLGVIDDCEFAPTLIGDATSDPYSTVALNSRVQPSSTDKADPSLYVNGLAINGTFLSCYCPPFQLDPASDRWPNAYVTWLGADLIQPLWRARAIGGAGAGGGSVPTGSGTGDVTHAPIIMNSMLSQAWCNSFIVPEVASTLGAFDINSDYDGNHGFNPNPNRATEPFTCTAQPSAQPINCVLSDHSSVSFVDSAIAKVPPVYSGLQEPTTGAPLSNTVVDPTQSVSDVITMVRTGVGARNVAVMGLSHEIIVTPGGDDSPDISAVVPSYAKPSQHSAATNTLLWGSTYGLMANGLSRASVTSRPYIPNWVDDCLLPLGTSSPGARQLWASTTLISGAEKIASWRLTMLLNTPVEAVVSEDQSAATVVGNLGQIMPPVHVSRRNVGQVAKPALVTKNTVVVDESFPRLAFGDTVEAQTQAATAYAGSTWRYGVTDAGRLWVLLPVMATAPLSAATAIATANPNHPWRYTMVNTNDPNDSGGLGKRTLQIVFEDTTSPALIWTEAQEQQEMPIQFWSSGYSSDPTNGEVDAAGTHFSQAAQIYTDVPPYWAPPAPPTPPASGAAVRRMYNEGGFIGGVDAWGDPGGPWAQGDPGGPWAQGDPGGPWAQGDPGGPWVDPWAAGAAGPAPTQRYVRSPHFRWVMGDLVSHAGPLTGAAMAPTTGLSGYTTYRVNDDVLLNPRTMKDEYQLDTATFMLDCGALIVGVFGQGVDPASAAKAAQAQSDLFYAALPDNLGKSGGTWPVPPYAAPGRAEFNWSDGLQSISKIGQAEDLFGYVMGVKYLELNTRDHGEWMANADSIYRVAPDVGGVSNYRPFFQVYIVWYNGPVIDDPAAQVQADSQANHIRYCSTSDSRCGAVPDPAPPPGNPSNYYPNADQCLASCRGAVTVAPVDTRSGTKCANQPKTPASGEVGTACSEKCLSSPTCEVVVVGEKSCSLYGPGECGAFVPSADSGAQVIWKETAHSHGTTPIPGSDKLGAGLSRAACVERCRSGAITAGTDPLATCRSVDVSGDYAAGDQSNKICRFYSDTAASADTTEPAGGWTSHLAPREAGAVGAATGAATGAGDSSEAASGSGVVYQSATFVIAEYVSQPHVSGAATAAPAPAPPAATVSCPTTTTLGHGWSTPCTATPAECEPYRYIDSFTSDLPKADDGETYAIPVSSDTPSLFGAGTNANLQFFSPKGKKILQFCTGQSLLADGQQAIYPGTLAGSVPKPATAAGKTWSQVFWVQNLYNQQVISSTSPSAYTSASYVPLQLQKLCISTMTMAPPSYASFPQFNCWNPLDTHGCPDAYRPYLDWGVEYGGGPVSQQLYPGRAGTKVGEDKIASGPLCSKPPSAPMVPRYAMPVCPCWLGDFELAYQEKTFGWAYADAHLNPKSGEPRQLNPIRQWHANASPRDVDVLSVCNNARCSFALADAAASRPFCGGDDTACNNDAYVKWVDTCGSVTDKTTICVEQVIVKGGQFVDNATINVKQSCGGVNPQPQPSPATRAWQSWLKWVIIGVIVAAVIGVVIGVSVSVMRDKKRAAMAQHPKLTRAEVLAALGGNVPVANGFSKPTQSKLQAKSAKPAHKPAQPTKPVVKPVAKPAPQLARPAKPAPQLARPAKPAPQLARPAKPAPKSAPAEPAPKSAPAEPAPKSAPAKPAPQLARPAKPVHAPLLS
jgi:hypothetical protein